MGTAALPRLGFFESLTVLNAVVVPTLAKGPLRRRRPVEGAAERLALDRRAIECMSKLRDRHGAGPVLLRLPFRVQALVLSPEDAQRALAETPDPFRADSSEKRAALAHFQPQGVLRSSGDERAQRREVNDAVLEAGDRAHSLTPRFAAVIQEEVAAMLSAASGRLDWDGFIAGWYRIVRRVVLGDVARDDHQLTDMLTKLRKDANWSFARPRREALRRRFSAGLQAHLERAEPGSLAALLSSGRWGPKAAPEQQVPQWLFAFEAAGIATFRALALLTAHPGALVRARQEARGEPASRPYLRTVLLESVRLWPTTPAILRETTQATEWRGARLPKGAGLLIFAPFLCRDPRLPFADRFAPEIWEGEPVGAAPGVIPFSDGPAVCPGRNLVLNIGSATLAELALRVAGLEPAHRLNPAEPMPATLDNFTLSFALA